MTQQQRNALVAMILKLRPRIAQQREQANRPNEQETKLFFGGWLLRAYIAVSGRQWGRKAFLSEIVPPPPIEGVSIRIIRAIEWLQDNRGRDPFKVEH